MGLGTDAISRTDAMRRTTKRTGQKTTPDELNTAVPGQAAGAAPEVAELSRHHNGLWEDPAANYHESDAEEVEEESDAEEAAAPADAGEGEDSHAPDDALGLYLRQMGAIPLLNRQQ